MSSSASSRWSFSLFELLSFELLSAGKSEPLHDLPSELVELVHVLSEHFNVSSGILSSGIIHVLRGFFEPLSAGLLCQSSELLPCRWRLQLFKLSGQHRDSSHATHMLKLLEWGVRICVVGSSMSGYLHVPRERHLRDGDSDQAFQQIYRLTSSLQWLKVTTVGDGLDFGVQISKLRQNDSKTGKAHLIFPNLGLLVAEVSGRVCRPLFLLSFIGKALGSCWSRPRAEGPSLPVRYSKLLNCLIGAIRPHKPHSGACMHCARATTPTWP